MGERKKLGKKMPPVRGEVKYAWLEQPDKQYKEEGQYHITIALDERPAEKLIASLEAIRDGAVKELAKEHKALRLQLKKGKPKLAECSWKPELNAEEEETGRTLFKFGMKASFESRNGDVIEQRPQIVDSKMTPCKGNLGKGSIVGVGFDAIPFFAPALGLGISLRLQSVQIIKLEKLKFGASAEDYHKELDDGYVAGNEDDDEDAEESGEDGEEGDVESDEDEGDESEEEDSEDGDDGEEAEEDEEEDDGDEEEDEDGEEDDDAEEDDEEGVEDADEPRRQVRATGRPTPRASPKRVKSKVRTKTKAPVKARAKTKARPTGKVKAKRRRGDF